MTRWILGVVAAIGLAGMVGPGWAAAQSQAEKTVAFIKDAQSRMEKAYEYANRTRWVQQTYITEDTEFLATEGKKRVAQVLLEVAEEARGYSTEGLMPDQKRQLEFIQKARFLSEGFGLPSPVDPDEAAELSQLSSELDTMYGTGKYCKESGECLSDYDIAAIMGSSRDPDELLEAWTGWRKVAIPMRDKYARLVTLANKGARNLGFDDLGVMWRSTYDMPEDEFPAFVDGLWEDVAPLYKSLQCHVRAKLEDHYGADFMPDNGMIPAHILGDIWGQLWPNIYDLVATDDTSGTIDIGPALKEKIPDARALTKTSESLFTSLGMRPLPESFWEKSLFDKPRDREVQCYGSAWDVTAKDVRVLMCTNVSPNHLWAMHHELGHVYYFIAYEDKPFLYRSGANPSFHEALGDFIALSLSPKYLKRLELIDQVPPAEADVNILLRQALHKVAVLPFTVMMDRWRWSVFDGTVKPDEYSKAWWALRETYQGVTAPVERTAEDFDPGAKYHIVRSWPYTRYFLAQLLQFQLFEKACEMAGHKGPLHRCSIYGNKKVGEKLSAMLALGSSVPWPDALEAFTGTREMSAQPLLDYFAPLKAWLDDENKGRACGWTVPEKSAKIRASMAY